MTIKDILRAVALVSGMVVLSSASAQTTPQDRAARALGFTNFAHYQRSLSMCANLVQGYLNSREPEM